MEGRFAKIFIDKILSCQLWIITKKSFFLVTIPIFYIVFTKLPSPQFTEVRFVFCFFLLLTDGWLTRQELSASSSQNKQR